MAKVVHLPSSKLSPRVLLLQLLQEIDTIETLTVVVQRMDTSMEVNWSNMSQSELCMSVQVLQANINKQLMEG